MPIPFIREHLFDSIINDRAQDDPIRAKEIFLFHVVDGRPLTGAKSGWHLQHGFHTAPDPVPKGCEKPDE